MLVPTATRPPILPLPGPSGRRVVSLDLEADLAPKRILRVPCSRFIWQSRAPRDFGPA